MSGPQWWTTLALGAGIWEGLRRLFRWLQHQEQETAFWRRERALAAYRERHPNTAAHGRCPLG